MGKLCRQSLKHDKLDFWKLALILVLTIVLMNIVMGWAVRFGAVVGSLAAVGILALGTVLCFRFIYRYLAQYDYRLIGKELILERALGRANHVVYTIGLEQVKSLVPYNQFDNATRIKRLHKFVLHKDTSKWYVVSYKEEEETKNLVFEPDENFLSGLQSSLDKAV
ncbi:hypothetical protein [Fusibacter sp. JL216-2]|uniref:hypothetical protein n=1 Tax=Fusibacter sp. JL216-2 TaxID=3071453 RepID=UPI003D351C82